VNIVWHSVATLPFPIDHIIPLSQNGTDNLDNLALACQHCNNCKYNKSVCADPLRGNVVSLFNPRLASWSDHFRWNEDYTMIIGTSATGRATVNCLKMNRQEAVNLRQALHFFGVHPPF
jgi:hypothetical protein